MSQYKYVILASDAMYSLLKDEPDQHEFVAELEVAHRLQGCVPMYPLSNLLQLNEKLSRDYNIKRRRNFNKFVMDLATGPYLGIPTGEDVRLGVQIFDSVLTGQNQHHQPVSFQDSLGLAMAIRLSAPLLTKDPMFVDLILKTAPDVPLPPFQDTLKAVEGGKLM